MVMMEHPDSRDRLKVVQRCSYALTGKACVDILVTDLAQFRRKNGRLAVEQVASGFTEEEVLALTGIAAAAGMPSKTENPWGNVAAAGRCRLLTAAGSPVAAGGPAVGWVTEAESREETRVPYVDSGEAKIWYTEQGTGFPMLALAPGGMRSSVPLWKQWGEQLMSKRDDLGSDEIEAFATTMWAHDFAVSVTRDQVRSFRTPMLVLPGVDEPHPTETGREIAALAPAAELLEPWKDPEHLPAATEAVGRFLQDHTPR